MSSDIVTLLQLDKELSSRVILVKEINRCDGSFITSCILNHCIKNKSRILLVSTHHSLQHYQNVGLRINYNLLRYVDTGLVEFFNFGEHCVNNLLSENNLSLFLQKVKEKIQTVLQKHETVSVILDGVSHLFDLNFSLKQVNEFCKDLFDFVTNNSKSFVVCYCNVANEDDNTLVMSNLLAHKAHIVCEVENLPSGLSADVSGHLTVTYPSLKFDSGHLYTMDIKPTHYLFKLFDRGVKLFAPGTV